ncbi:uncharacterized protein [Dysidea avara]|uniref:uncharacterized protein n=1 Tax=Dysidea avara TaxID=196820 RepID=UPI00333442ED
MASRFLNCCCIFPTRPTGDHDTPARTDKNEVAIDNRSMPYCVGRWLPSDQAILDRWLQKQIKEVDGKAQPEPLNPVVQSFKDAIESSAELTMFFNEMFTETPTTKRSQTSQSEVRNYHHMLQLMNNILLQAPEYNPDGPSVVVSMYAILYKQAGTTGGYAAFLNTTVNFHLKKILNTWAKFLMSPSSCYVLTTDGWLSNQCIEKMGGNFEEQFVCDPSKPHYGFTSWDDFFTRQARPNARPIAHPDDDKVIVNACESAPLRVERNASKHGKFWIKGQPYNLKFMLANEPLADRFVGGTVYQGFLDIYYYHRWHSPVNGKIVKAYVQDGTYYSEPLIKDHFDQGYLAEVQTRAIIAIEADNPYIGLMCFVAIGMVEVSSCDITVTEGQWVKKGQQLGMFHFGGSTHCLIFRPGVELKFDFHGGKPGPTATKVLVNSKLATVPE